MAMLSVVAVVSSEIKAIVETPLVYKEIKGIWDDNKTGPIFVL